MERRKNDDGDDDDDCLLLQESLRLTPRGRRKTTREGRHRKEKKGTLYLEKEAPIKGERSSLKGRIIALKILILDLISAPICVQDYDTPRIAISLRTLRDRAIT